MRVARHTVASHLQRRRAQRGVKTPRPVRDVEHKGEEFPSFSCLKRAALVLTGVAAELHAIHFIKRLQTAHSSSTKHQRNHTLSFHQSRPNSVAFSTRLDYQHYTGYNTKTGNCVYVFHTVVAPFFNTILLVKPRKFSNI